MTSPDSQKRNEKHVQGSVEELSQIVEPKDKALENREMVRKLEDYSVQCQKILIPESENT